MPGKSKSKSEIRRTLERYNATGFHWLDSPEKVSVGFAMNTDNGTRVIRIDLVDMPDGEQATRQRYRAILLYIKSMLEAVEVGIMSIEEAFMPHLMLANGRTVAEYIMPTIVSEDADVPLLGSGY